MRSSAEAAILDDDGRVGRPTGAGAMPCGVTTVRWRRRFSAGVIGGGGEGFWSDHDGLAQRHDHVLCASTYCSRPTL
jgi:hypothetical protein